MLMRQFKTREQYSQTNRIKELIFKIRYKMLS